jgi:hypothetical protein
MSESETNAMIDTLEIMRGTEDRIVGELGS